MVDLKVENNKKMNFHFYFSLLCLLIDSTGFKYNELSSQVLSTEFIAELKSWQKFCFFLLLLSMKLLSLLITVNHFWCSTLLSSNFAIYWFHELNWRAFQVTQLCLYCWMKQEKNVNFSFEFYYLTEWKVCRMKKGKVYLVKC